MNADDVDIGAAALLSWWIENRFYTHMVHHGNMYEEISNNIVGRFLSRSL